MLQSLNYKYSPGEKVVMFLVYTWIWHISCKLTGSIMSGEYSVRICILLCDLKYLIRGFCLSEVGHDLCVLC